jgi:hypothetical protein
MPLDSKEKASLTECGEEILALCQIDRCRIWGSASPPGRFASTVIQVANNFSHRFAPTAAVVNLEGIGLKLYKTDSAVRSEAARLVRFHQHQMERLPGLPNSRVQKSVAAGCVLNRRGQEQYYVVQEWAFGETLDQFLKRCRETAEGKDNDGIPSIIHQLFAKIVFPLWSAGTVWWDFRAGDGNSTVATDDAAFGKNVELQYREAWLQFEPVLRMIGRSHNATLDASGALSEFIRDLREKNLLAAG